MLPREIWTRAGVCGVEPLQPCNAAIYTSNFLMPILAIAAADARSASGRNRNRAETSVIIYFIPRT